MTDYSINLYEMGQRIKILRLKQRKTQEYFADMIYISPSYLALIENGKRTPTIDVLARISKICNTSVDYLLFGTPESPADINQRIFHNLVAAYSSEKISSALKLASFYLEME